MRDADEPHTDPLDRARLLERVHAAVLSGGEGPSPPRRLVRESWQRSLAAEIDPNGWKPPVTLDEDQLPEARGSHPLAVCLPVLRRTLLESAGGAPHIMIVTDARGNILWREGDAAVRRRADAVRLSEGTQWAETAIGTNAMGTALATGSPVQIHSAEHLVCTYHSWTCAASPIRDPETGAVLGSVDISGPLHTMHPALQALVSAAAQLAENELATRAARERDRERERGREHLRELRGEPGALLDSDGRVVAAEPRGLPLPDHVDVRRPGTAAPAGEERTAVLEPRGEGYLLRLPPSRGRRTSPPLLRLRFLDRHRPLVEVDGRVLPLGARHAELLAALALRGKATSEQLTLLIHGEAGNPGTVRAEIHRLRARLGGAVVSTAPYRLDARLEADFRTLREHLLRGEVLPAVRMHGRGLLPASEAPVVREEREDLAAGLRAAVLGDGDPDPLWEYVRTEAGHDDVEALERLTGLLPDGDWRAGTCRARLTRLLHEPD
ncbi:GAF domain-containing protein [Haloactinospora alba]|uniref:GAF domain-containing protein n=1 Tax=Haloactinospora alba TaxID=405555 RepID=A0A543NNH3_9ACTN|nr:GAF domain-containing protein [Haloactinospora alba]TQN33375.1 GAF domain-containing protein [Haloactinospora alba]